MSGRRAERPSQLIEVADPSAVGDARRAARALALAAGLDETRSGQAALVATEMATNLFKHAGGGHVVLRGVSDGGRGAVDLLALDRGPGVPNLARSLVDGVSTGTSPGTGLGAIRRAASVFEAFSQPGHGTAVFARVGAHESRPGAWLTGGLSVAKSGETVAGDAWAVREGPGTLRVLVADGLGHGPQAAEASEAAVAAFLDAPGKALTSVLEDCHRRLRSTRGAAVVLAEVDAARGEVRCAGVGNVAATIWSPSGTRSLVSLNGTLGSGQVRLREFSHPWTRGSLLIVASDGLRTHWSLDAYPGLAARHPALVSGVLYRDHQRGTDDVTVVVAGSGGAGP